MMDMYFFVAFNILIIFLLILDLFVFHKNPHEVSIKESLWMTFFWIVLALCFNILIYFTRGLDDALSFFTGFLIEKSLSVDNLFIFLMLFSYFHLPKHLTHVVLFWGILGAIIMRAIFIFVGVALVQQFSWIMYVFGVFLIFTGYKLFFESDKKIDPETNFVLRTFRKFFSVTKNYENGYFFVKKEGKYFATPLFIVLLAVETTDLIFAIDSIPAIMAITLDPFIIYTSNVFAILGLRSLFFALSGLMGLFHYLHYGLASILVFIGLKMLIAHHYKLPVIVTLGFVVLALGISIIASLIWKEKDSKHS